MEVKEAVTVAKQYIADLYSDERIENIGLEEVEFDGRGSWLVTIGFSRPWHRNSAWALVGSALPRDYKVLRISDTKKEVVSVKDRARAN
jgi:hypothetical protein